MTLTKQNISLNFAQGLDLKTDPFQLAPGKFLSLENSIFTKGGLLSKRNGFGRLPSLPSSDFSYATTFNGNLTAVGKSLSALSLGSQTWVDKGTIRPLQLNSLPLIRNNTNQSTCDAVIAPNGLVCTAYTDQDPSNLSQSVYRYAIADSTTGQNVVAPTTLTASGTPRVFLLGKYFIVVFSNATHLQYVAINIYTLIASSQVDISTTYTSGGGVTFDGFVANNSLFLAWYNSAGPEIILNYLDSTLTIHTPVTIAAAVCSVISVCADITQSTPVIWVSYFNGGTSLGYVAAFNQQLTSILAPTQIIAAGQVPTITAVAEDSAVTVFYEVINAYSYDSAIRTDYIKKVTVTQGGSVGSTTIIARSVGLASKAFILDGSIYMLAAYSSPYQPSYFMIDSSGHVVAKVAYSNGGGYLAKGLPNFSIYDSTVSIPYLVKDTVIPVNKAQGAAQSAAIYSQLGINLASFTINTDGLNSAEIGGNLNLSGGFLWAYDGYSPVESNFHLWPDSVELTGSTTGGTMTAQQYFYAATYEWADNQGNVFKSAPSVPVTVTTTGTTSSVTVNVPTLRLTYKTANPVKIVIYRWSTAQQTYYQVTSLSSPTLNSTTTDSVAFLDILPDSAIIGNSILYTTGGVVENIGPPAVSVMTLFKSRLFFVDAEDQNLLGYSKQVIENTPVETSDLFTIYVAPTTAAQGNTGPIKALSAMDDKLIIFKKNAIYYITGTGPDNTGAQNDFSEPVFITSTVGCENQNSIVFIPQGLMFQSDKGIWLLGRDLSTSYVGAAVEAYNEDQVRSALTIPGTNQVRFTLDSGVTLMYDYYYSQWGTFNGVPAVSSTLYQSLHTYFDSLGRCFQESPASYLDGANPVLMAFITSWLNLAGLQGYQRAYFFYLLGTYLTPHKLSVSIAYDYAPAPSQTVLISPDNYNGAYGSDPLYGSSTPFGGNPQLEQWRVFLTKQRCQSFQVSLQEIYDPAYGVAAGKGLTLSGLNLIVALKKGWRPISAANSVGGG